MFDLKCDTQHINTAKKEQENNLKFAQCSGGNQCHQVCVYANCEKEGVICSIDSCQCHDKHKKLCTWISPSKVVYMIQCKKQFNEDLANIITKRFDDLIDKISVERQKIISEVRLAGLSEAERRYLSLSAEQEFKQINGKLVSKILQGLNYEQPSKQIQQRKQILAETLWMQAQKPLETALSQLSKTLLKNIKTQGTNSYKRESQPRCKNYRPASRQQNQLQKNVYRASKDTAQKVIEKDFKVEKDRKREQIRQRRSNRYDSDDDQY